LSQRDLIKLAVGFLVTSLLVLIAGLFPLYRVYPEKLSNGYLVVRRPIWDPPFLIQGSEVERDESLSQDDRDEKSIEALPGGESIRTVKASPMIFKIRARGQDKDWLGLLAFAGIGFYIALVLHTWFNRG